MIHPRGVDLNGRLTVRKALPFFSPLISLSFLAFSHLIIWLDLYRAEQYKANRVDEDSDHEIDRVRFQLFLKSHLCHLQEKHLSNVIDPRFTLETMIAKGTSGTYVFCFLLMLCDEFLVRYVLGESVGSVLDPREPDRRRYKLLARIGQGTFGRVFSCWDRLEHRFSLLYLHYIDCIDLFVV